MMQSRFGVHFNIYLYHGNETREEITINCNFDDYMYTTEQAIKCVFFLKEVNKHAVFSDQTV